MARKPQPGGDRNAWGLVMNEFLDTAHNPDGTIKPAGVQTAVATEVETALSVQLPPAVADAVAADSTVAAAAAAAVDAEPRVSQLISDVSGIEGRVDEVEPAALSAKSRTIDLADTLAMDGVTDDTAALQSALNDASNLAISEGVTAKSVFLRGGSNTLISDTINLPPHVLLIGDGPKGARLIAAPGMNVPMFVLDPSVTPNSSTRRYAWRVENISLVGPGKEVSGSKGFYVNNGLQGVMKNVHINGFETGLDIDAHNLANGAACYYNDFYSFFIQQCALGIVIGPQANSNRFFGGNILGNGQGLWIKGATNNEFFGTDIEGNGDATTPAVRIDGNGNGLVRTRMENNAATIDVHFTSSAWRNTVSPYWSSTHPASRVQDDHPNKGNTVIADGYYHLGNGASNTAPSVIRATRSAVAAGKPFIDIEDTYSSSGDPVGYQYKYRRPNSTPFRATYNTGSAEVITAELRDGSVLLSHRSGTSSSLIVQYHDTPNGVYTAPPGSICMVNSPTTPANNGMWVKETGTGNTGWVKK